MYLFRKESGCGLEFFFYTTFLLARCLILYRAFSHCDTSLSQNRHATCMDPPIKGPRMCTLD